MRGEQWIAGLIRPPAPPAEPTWSDVIARAKSDHPGRGAASAYLAAAMDVSRSTARRYLAGQTRPGPGRTAQADALRGQLRAERQAAHTTASRKQTADFLRLIDKLRPGRVKVESKSGELAAGNEHRTVGWVNVAGGMDTVADLWEAGRPIAAADALSDLIMNVYGGGDPADSGGLGDDLEITDYENGMDYR